MPISGMVRAILETRPQNGRDYVFGVGQQRGFSGWSRAKANLDEAVKIPGWRIHDLRRLCSTGMNEIGIPPWIVEAVLNHVSGQSAVSRTYNRASFELEKATALARWAEHIAAIVEGRDSNITPLRGAL